MTQAIFHNDSRDYHTLVETVNKIQSPILIGHTNFVGFSSDLLLGRYLTRPISATNNCVPHLALRDHKDGCPVATATVNVVEDGASSYVWEKYGAVYIKDYSENSGMAECLIGSGIIDPVPVQAIASGHVILHAYRLDWGYILESVKSGALRTVATYR